MEFTVGQAGDWKELDREVEVDDVWRAAVGGSGAWLLVSMIVKLLEVSIDVSSFRNSNSNNDDDEINAKG